MLEKLQNNKVDLIVVSLKASLGVVPYAGGILAEVIGNTIPNQRIDRITKFIEILSEKVKDIEEEVIKNKMQIPEYIDLFEDCLWASTRALNDDRKEYIANIFANGIKDDELNIINQKKLLLILNQLDDIDLLFLKFWAIKEWSEEEQIKFFKNHEKILSPIHVFSNDGKFEDKIGLEYNLIHKRNLLNLGLIEIEKQLNDTIFSETDWVFVKVKRLGLLLLKEIHQLPENYEIL